LKSISTQNGTSSLVIDYVQWISPCVADASTSYCMNGYAVVNSNSQLRTFPIASDVQVKLQTYSITHDSSGNFNWNQIVPLTVLAEALNNQTGMYPAKNLLYWITLNKGVVTDITEQYQP